VKLTIIAALSSVDRCIGKAGALPWSLKEDMAHFKAETMGKPVIMGRRTFESLPPKFRPLPGRRSVVLTRDAELLAARHVGEKWPDTIVVDSFDGALAAVADVDEACVIGGAEVYAAALPVADRLVLTWVDVRVYGGDAFFPELNWLHWRSVNARGAETFGGVFWTYERIGGTR